MPTSPVTVFAKDDAVRFTGHALDRCSNGNLVFMLADLAPNPDVFHVFISIDDGANWSEALDSQGFDSGGVGFGTQTMATFIDQDDYIHWCYMEGGGLNHMQYRRATPNAARTQWTWSDEQQIDEFPSGSAIPGGVVAHRDGTGWRVHFVYGDNLNNDIYYRNLVVNSDGSFGALSTETLVSSSVNTSSNQPRIDLRHTGDGKTPHATPNVYVVYLDNSANGIRFRKFSYSGGSWSMGTERAIATISGSVTPDCIFDGTRVLIPYSSNGTAPSMSERDEADTTTTANDPPALSDGSIQQILGMYRSNGDTYLYAVGATSLEPKWVKYDRGGVSWGSWASLEVGINVAISGYDHSLKSGAMAAVVYRKDTSPDEHRFVRIAATLEASATLQGVATLSAAGRIGHNAGASLQGVATLDSHATLGLAGSATLQGVATLGVKHSFTPKLDFTVYDLYLDDGENVYACIAHEDDQTKGSTNANPIRAEKQDVGQNPLEQRPEFGDHFAQGDFSHGAGQEHFHHVGRDERKYFLSEGFDISDPGDIQHLHAVDETLDTTTIGRVTQAMGVLFAADGTVVKKHDGVLPGQWVPEDPHAGESATDVEDVASRGDEVFAALGSNGVHIRSSSGAWTHFKPDGSTNLSVGAATRVAWLKDRLMVVGTGGREIFEVVADSTPAAIKTLPEGWTFESIFEAGAFLYAPAVNADAGLSRVHIFGLNSTASALEDKGSVPIPRGELIYVGIGDPGGIFLGGGRRTPDGGYDPVFYQAVQGESGFLQLLKITQGEGAGPLDCSVRAFESLGDAIVMGWSVGSDSVGGARTGLAWYHLGRQAFANHLRKTVPTASPVTDIIFHKGILFFVVDGDGLYYEVEGEFVSEAYLISSIADWGSAGLKSWDQVEVSHKALPSTASVVLQFTTEHPEEDVAYTTAVTSSTAGALGAAGRLSDIISRLFTVKLVSRAATDLMSAPSIQGFSVRSNPTRSRPEYILTRFIRVLAKDRKDKRGSVVYVDPVARRIAIQQLLDSWVTVYEPGITWTAFVRSVADAEPAEPFLSDTNGEPLKEAYLVRLDMIATGEAA